MQNYKIGIAGFGTMGQAILKGMLSSESSVPENIAVLSRSKNGKDAARECKVILKDSAAELAEFSDIVILAVKPKDSLELISALCPALSGKALLSIVAGIDYAAIYKQLWGVKARVMVSLPNTALQTGDGIIAFTNETSFTKNEKDAAVFIFSKMASVEWINEKQIAAFSAVAGSGPAFAALAIEALADGGVLEGLPRATALRIAAKTLQGTGALVNKAGLHPAIIKDGVCSPGGTSIEGIAELEKYSFRAALIAAVHAAKEKFTRLL